MSRGASCRSLITAASGLGERSRPRPPRGHLAAAKITSPAEGDGRPAGDLPALVDRAARSGSGSPPPACGAARIPDREIRVAADGDRALARIAAGRRWSRSPPRSARARSARPHAAVVRLVAVGAGLPVGDVRRRVEPVRASRPRGRCRRCRRRSAQAIPTARPDRPLLAQRRRADVQRPVRFSARGQVQVHRPGLDVHRQPAVGRRGPRPGPASTGGRCRPAPRRPRPSKPMARATSDPLGVHRPGPRRSSTGRTALGRRALGDGIDLTMQASRSEPA